MATRMGLEPTASSVTGWRSNQLSYRAGSPPPYSPAARFIISKITQNVNSFFAIFSFFRVRQKLLQFPAAEGIYLIAELAGHFAFFLLRRHLRQFLFPHADQRTLDLFPATGTAVADLIGLQKIHIKPIEYRLYNLLQGHPLFEHGSHGLELGKVGLQPVDILVLHARH